MPRGEPIERRLTDEEVATLFLDAAVSERTQHWLEQAPLLQHVEVVLEGVGRGLRARPDGTFAMDAAVPLAMGVSAAEVVEPDASVRGRHWARVWGTCASQHLTRFTDGVLGRGDGTDLWWDDEPVLLGLARQWFALGYLQRTARPRPDIQAGAGDELCQALTMTFHAVAHPREDPGCAGPSTVDDHTAGAVHDQLVHLAELGLVTIGARVTPAPGAEAIFAVLGAQLHYPPESRAA